MDNPKRFEELSKESKDLILFFLKDNSFDMEFLLTAVQEYYQANK